MSEHPIQGLMATVMSSIKEMVDVNTIVGQPITTGDGTTIIPVSKVSFGFAGGGSDFTTKTSQPGANPFGGGSGAGVNITPVAFLIISEGQVKLLPVATDMSPTDRAIGMIPDVVDKISAIFSKREEE